MEEQWIWRNGEVVATGISRGKGGLGDTGWNRVKGGYGWNALYKRKKTEGIWNSGATSSANPANSEIEKGKYIGPTVQLD